MEIINKDGWDGWMCGNGYIFNENLGLKFTVEDLNMYWIERQRLKEYEKWRNRIIQYKFDFIYE